MTSRRHAPFDSGDAEDGLGALRPMKLETAGEVKRGGGCSAVPLWIQRLALLLGVPLAIVLTLTVLYQSETGFVYTLGQCLWRTYGSVDEYSKSGTVYDSVTAVFTAQDSGGAGFFSARLPTDKRTRHNYPEVYDRVRCAMFAARLRSFARHAPAAVLCLQLVYLASIWPLSPPRSPSLPPSCSCSLSPSLTHTHTLSLSSLSPSPCHRPTYVPPPLCVGHGAVPSAGKRHSPRSRRQEGRFPQALA